MIEPILDREEPVGGTRRRRGIFATHEQFPSRPPEHPVAKSPGGEHVTAGEPIRHRFARDPTGALHGQPHAHKVPRRTRSSLTRSSGL